jgi:hypothetical protein
MRFPRACCWVTMESARALVTRFEEERHLNPHTGTPEFSLRDPDGYYVTISALPLDAEGNGPAIDGPSVQ